MRNVWASKVADREMVCDAGNGTCMAPIHIGESYLLNLNDGRVVCVDQKTVSRNEKQLLVRDLIGEAIEVEGVQHKQYKLLQAARLLGMDADALAEQFGAGVGGEGS